MGSVPFRKGLHRTSLLQKGWKLWFQTRLQEGFKPNQGFKTLKQNVLKPFYKRAINLMTEVQNTQQKV